MIESKIPGIKAKHAIVRKQCIENKGDIPAGDEALGILFGE